MIIENDVNRFNVAELFATELDENEMAEMAKKYTAGSVIKYYDGTGLKVYMLVLDTDTDSKKWVSI